MVTTLPEVVSGKRYKNVGDLKNTAETSVTLNFKRTRTVSIRHRKLLRNVLSYYCYVWL